jgi:outer membrane protein TolC
VLKTQELVKVSKEILARSQENTAATKVHVQVGNLIPADIATSQVREANDELSLLSNENDLKIAMATLPRLMGMKPGTVVIVAEDADYAQYRDRGEIEVTEMAVEEAIQLAYENRPEFKELNSLLAQREADMKLAKLGRLPQLDADFNYAVNLDDYLHEREDFNQFRSWDFTTRLNFPIFDGGVTKRRVQEVDLLLNQTREDAQDLERSIALETRQAFLNLKRAERALDISGTQVRNAELSLEVIRGRFQQELAFLLELLDSQTNYAQALTNQVRSFYDYKIARSALQRAIGTLN